MPPHLKFKWPIANKKCIRQLALTGELKKNPQTIFPHFRCIWALNPLLQIMAPYENGLWTFSKLHLNWRMRRKLFHYSEYHVLYFAHAFKQSCSSWITGSRRVRETGKKVMPHHWLTSKECIIQSEEKRCGGFISLCWLVWVCSTIGSLETWT